MTKIQNPKLDGVKQILKRYVIPFTFWSLVIEI
jgi:hypothetical protein